MKEEVSISLCSFRSLWRTSKLQGTVRNTLGMMVLRRQDAIVMFLDGAELDPTTSLLDILRIGACIDWPRNH